MRMVTVRVKNATPPMPGACPLLKTSDDSLRVAYVHTKRSTKANVMIYHCEYMMLSL